LDCCIDVDLRRIQHRQAGSGRLAQNQGQLGSAKDQCIRSIGLLCGMHDLEQALPCLRPNDVLR
jgi:hypothetical protein